MNSANLLIFCWAFIIGCIASIFSTWANLAWLGAMVMLGLGIATASVALRFDSIFHSIKPWVWLVAGLIGCFAVFYMQIRVPQPFPDDISNFVGATKTITGTVLDLPMISSSGKGKFTLGAQEIKLRSGERKMVQGKAYVTMPLTQVTGIKPAQQLEISGNLYLPQPPDNPGGFDFQAFLARSGIFVGLSGKSLKTIGDPPIFGDWWVRSRMVRAYVLGAGMPEGALLGALVLGNRAVDLPADLKQTFIEVGLAPALAVSGFQVSIILGAVLFLAKNCSNRLKFGLGTISLCGFLILTGVSPSVLRAVVMGMGTLVGLVFERQVRPVAGLTLAAVILLLIQPLWIWDLGFQFSFLATLGLVVSSKSIAARLEWMPPLFANLLSVPIAAYVWILPLQLYVFGRVSIYSILANVLTVPLVSFGTIIGTIAGVLGVIYIPLGALISWLLTVPMAVMIATAYAIHALPGAITNAGTIDLWQLIAAYFIILLLWLRPLTSSFLAANFLASKFLAPKIWLPVMVIILFVPGILTRANLVQASIISSNRAPVMLIQDHGKVFLINSGNQRVANFALLPLLQKAGINQIDWAIATNSATNSESNNSASTNSASDISTGWESIISASISIKNFVALPKLSTPKSNSLKSNSSKNLSELNNFEQILDKFNTKSGDKINFQYLNLNQPLEIGGETQIELIHQNPDLLKLQIADTAWILLADINSGQKLFSEKLSGNLTQKLSANSSFSKLKTKILWWTGADLDPQLLSAIQPNAAIASTNQPISESTIRQLQAAKIDFYQTSQDGAIIWTKTNQASQIWSSQIRVSKERQNAESPI